jgi:hypothetical protein
MVNLVHQLNEILGRNFDGKSSKQAEKRWKNSQKDMEVIKEVMKYGSFALFPILYG